MVQIKSNIFKLYQTKTGLCNKELINLIDVLHNSLILGYNIIGLNDSLEITLILIIFSNKV